MHLYPFLLFRTVMDIKFVDPNSFEVERMADNARVPEKAHADDLGWDLFCSEQVTIHPGEYTLVSTGVKFKFPTTVGAFIKDRSSISSGKGIFIHAGVIDSGYRGEVKILMHNVSEKTATFYRGDKIAQMVLIQIASVNLETVNELSDVTDRRDAGFGSTGG